CDCYANRREGVNRILDSVAEAAGPAPVRIWTTTGRFRTIDDVRRDPLCAASANWLAQATWAARLVPNRNVVLLDMGSTTTDVIPIAAGRAVPRGLTDAQRLKSGELLCMGWRRTPAAAILNIGQQIMTEYFATTLDACLVSGIVPQDQEDFET